MNALEIIEDTPIVDGWSGSAKVISQELERPGDRKCPLCNARLMKEYDNWIFLTNPPIRHIRWWCNCGYRGEWEHEKQGIARKMGKGE